MPNTMQEFVDCVAGFVEAIHPLTPTRDLVFALVASVLDTLLVVWKPVFLLQPMFLPQEPFHGALVVVGDESSLDRFGSDGVFLHAVEAMVILSKGQKPVRRTHDERSNTPLGGV